jgi:predicted DNA-binding protein (MmcQ/YjbR family)
MTYDDLLALCLDLPGAWPDEPWSDHTVPKVGTGPGKIFAFPGADPPSVAVKLPPSDGVELRAAYPEAVGDAPYLSKKHWVRVLLDGTVPDDEVSELVQASYDLVVSALPRAQRPG